MKDSLDERKEDMHELYRDPRSGRMMPGKKDILKQQINETEKKENRVSFCGENISRSR